MSKSCSRSRQPPPAPAPAPAPPPTPASHSPFPMLRWGKAGSCRRPWAPGTLHPEPLRGGSPARSLAFFTWLCKREGARRCRQCRPVRPLGRGRWYGPRPRGCQLGEGPALKGAVGAAGPVVHDTVPPHPVTAHRGPRSWKVQSHVDLAVLGPPASPPKLAGPRAMVQSSP